LKQCDLVSLNIDLRKVDVLDVAILQVVVKGCAGDVSDTHPFFAERCERSVATLPGIGHVQRCRPSRVAERKLVDHDSLGDIVASAVAPQPCAVGWVRLEGVHRPLPANLQGERKRVRPNVRSDIEANAIERHEHHGLAERAPLVRIEVHESLNVVPELELENGPLELGDDV